MLRLIAICACLLTACAPLPTAAVPDPDKYFLSQLNPKAVPYNDNCGPASLAMALKAYGKGIYGTEADPEALIMAARLAMTGGSDPKQETNTDLIIVGAKKEGLQAEYVKPAAYDGLLAAGKLVVLPGNPIAYGKRLTQTQYWNPGYDGGHLILLVGKSATGYWVDDPLSVAGKLEITPAELAAYQAYKDWTFGVAVYP